MQIEWTRWYYKWWGISVFICFVLPTPPSPPPPTALKEGMWGRQFSLRKQLSQNISLCFPLKCHSSWLSKAMLFHPTITSGKKKKVQKTAYGTPGVCVCVSVCAGFLGCIFPSPLKCIHFYLRILWDFLSASFPPLHFRADREDGRKVK